MPPSSLKASHVAAINEALDARTIAQSTKHHHAQSVRAILRWLWENHGAPKLDSEVITYPTPRPRNVIASDKEIDKLLNHAPPHLLLWLLLCSDLAIRSGTAARIGPEHYNRSTQCLHFSTKYGARLTLPVTDELAYILAPLDHGNGGPYCYQLRAKEAGGPGSRPSRKTEKPAQAYSRNFRDLRRKLGITRKLTPHDFRRTAAVKLYQYTRDVRTVQSFLGHRSLASTIWYLDHDLTPVDRSALEHIKRRNLNLEPERQQA